ncbi:hypothetical protein PCZ31_1717 [Clostridioides difficile]|nr:hypothetical protein PCZ31_1717 [Clostridioides difficile]
MVGAEKTFLSDNDGKIAYCSKKCKKKEKKFRNRRGKKMKEYKIEIEETIFLKHKVIVEVLE